MPSIPLPGETFTFSIPLVSQADSHLFQVAPTIAAGDFKRSINNGSFANLDNLPTVTPTGGRLVQIVLSASETTEAGEGGTIDIVGSDAAGSEWDDIGIAVRVGVIAANAAQISGDSTAADNAESFFDGTGYAGTNNTIPTVTTLTNMPPAAPSAASVATQVWTGPDTKQINSVSGSVNSVTTGVTLADDAITSAKFDEITAFPVKLADTGSTKIARVGADSDTLETLSDQLDAIQLVTDAIDTSAVTVTSTNDAGVLTITRGVTFAATVSGLTISGTWSKLYFTLKESDYDDDDDAIVQIVETNPGALTDGLLYLDSAAIVSPITVADGTLTVNQAGGTVAIAITDNATAHLAKASGLVWDIKTKDAAGATVQNATGTASIVRAITQTI